MSTFLRRSMLKLYRLTLGRQMLAYFDELKRNQWLSRDELLALQQSKIQQLVTYAYHYIPYYRRTFDELGFHPEDLRRDPATFQKLPLLTKETMRHHSDEFKTTHPTVRQTLAPRSTSGSTGEPFTFWEDKRYRDCFTATFLWYFTWSGWRLGEPYALLWGQSQPPEKSLLPRVRGKLTDFVFNSPLISGAYILSQQEMEILVSRIRRINPRVLLSYASTLFVLAQFVRQQQLDIKFQAVYSSGETLYPHQRQYIEETFGCKVFNRYGTLESRGIACECEVHDGLHISMENCYIELVRDGVPVEDEQPGEIVVTELNNYGFPFIRYRVKDVVQRLEQACPCGRQSPLLAAIQGRVGDTFKTTTGKTVWNAAFELFKLKGIKQYQVIQKALDLILVRLVRDEDFAETQIQVVEKMVKDIMGAETTVQFEFPDHIAIAASGKYRYSYSELGES
jgi:phenylacetate-CoA ligase